MNNKNPFCVDFYLKSRNSGYEENSIPSDIGINWIQPFPKLLKVFNDFNKSIFSNNKILFYTRPGGDIKDRELLAELLNIYVEKSIFKFGDIVLTNSSSEALEIYFDFLSQKRVDIILPLPCYFKYDLLALRKNINVDSYYSIAGFLKTMRGSNNKTCLLINNPEAVSGRYKDFSFYENLLQDNKKRDYFLFDFCYLTLDISNNIKTHSFFEEIVNKQALQQSAITLTPSKDISIASYRAGLLLSKNEELISHAKSKIMERYFTLNIISTYSMIMYLIFIIVDKYRRTSVYVKLKEIRKLLKEFGYDYNFLSNEFVEDFINYHQNEVIGHIKNNFLHMKSYDNLFDFKDYDIPEAGFSAIWKLNTSLPKLKKIIKLTRDIAIKDKVNIYPAYYNGGNESIWQDLYPGDFLIRVNSSLSTNIINEQMSVLIKHL